MNTDLLDPSTLSDTDLAARIAAHEECAAILASEWGDDVGAEIERGLASAYRALLAERA